MHRSESWTSDVEEVVEIEKASARGRLIGYSELQADVQRLFVYKETLKEVQGQGAGKAVLE